MSGLFEIFQIVDVSIYHFLNRFAGNWFFDRIVIQQQANHLFKGCPFVAAYWFFWFRPGSDLEKRRRAIIAILVGTVLTLVIALTVATVTPLRIRPLFAPNLEHRLSASVATGWSSSSFPSDTAAFFGALAFGLTRLSRRLTVPVLLYTAGWIYFPRIYLGLHYTSDVIAGVVIGVAAVWAVLRTEWPQSAVASRALVFMDSRPDVFYAAAFLISFEMASMFNDIRDIERSLAHAARATRYNTIFGFSVLAFAAVLLLAAFTATCILVVSQMAASQNKLRAKRHLHVTHNEGSPSELSVSEARHSDPAAALGIPLAESRFKERRSHQRVWHQTLATVTDGQHSLSACTKNISDRGLFLVTDKPVAEGNRIDIVLTLPKKVGLSLSGKVCCLGRVVRSGSVGGRHGIAVHFDGKPSHIA